MFIGEIIKKYRIENNISQRAFASKTSLSASYINTLEKVYDTRTGKPISVTIEAAKEIAKAMQITIDGLLSLLEDTQEPKLNVKTNTVKNTFIKIPLLKTIRSDYNYFSRENWIGTIDVNRNLSDGGNLFALQVHDDSMSPAIIEDDILIIRQQNDFESGDIVVAIINGNEATVKKGKKNDNNILLQPFNLNYEPLVFTYNEMKTIPVTIIGVVKQLKRDF